MQGTGPRGGFCLKNIIMSMEWYQEMSGFASGLPEWLKAHPQYAYQLFVAVLALLLAGAVCNWKWTWRPHTSWGWTWLEAMGERTFRFWKSVVYAALIVFFEILFFKLY